MQRWRWVMATAIVVGLGALVAVLIQNGPVPTTTTGSTTTTTTAATTTATSAGTTSTTTAEQRAAEVEAILEELWFGWFDAIYRKDADALWEVVGSKLYHDAGLAAMSALEFEGEPTQESVVVEVMEILLDRVDCLVVHESTTAQFIGSSESSVSVLWPDDRYGWRIANSWANPEDQWLTDCNDVLREVTP